MPHDIAVAGTRYWHYRTAELYILVNGPLDTHHPDVTSQVTLIKTLLYGRVVSCL